MTELLVGTRKGLYVLEGEPGAPFEVDGPRVRRRARRVRDARSASGRVFASVTSAFYGPKVFYADDPTAEVWEQAAVSNCPRAASMRSSASGWSCRARPTA